jgi:hypothetical protein
MAEDGLPPGFVFAPPDHALIKDVLRRKVAGLPINSRYNIHNFDAYSVPPDELVAKHEHAPGTDKNDGKGGYWYFFTPVRRHKTKNGVVGRRKRGDGDGYTWHSENREKPVVDEGAKGAVVGSWL